jgi:hypothetical protein
MDKRSTQAIQWEGLLMALSLTLAWVLLMGLARTAALATAAQGGRGRTSRELRGKQLQHLQMAV